MNLIQNLLYILQRYGVTKYILIGGGESVLEDIESFYSKLRPIDFRKESLNMIRVGNQNGDGGYLIPRKVMQTIDVCVSAGVGKEYNFEKQFLDTGKKVIAIDEVLPEDGELSDAICISKRLTPSRSSSNETHLEEVLDFFVAKTSKLILKLDIEGDEYGILNSMSNEQLKRFAVIVCEFHSLSALRHPFARKKILIPTLERLCDFFLPIHVHVNNSVENWRFGTRIFPEALEVTFVQKPDVEQDYFFADLPHAYDVPTDPTIKEFPIQDFFEKI